MDSKLEVLTLIVLIFSPQHLILSSQASSSFMVSSTPKYYYLRSIYIFQSILFTNTLWIQKKLPLFWQISFNHHTLCGMIQMYNISFNMRFWVIQLKTLRIIDIKFRNKSRTHFLWRIMVHVVWSPIQSIIDIISNWIKMMKSTWWILPNHKHLIEGDDMNIENGVALSIPFCNWTLQWQSFYLFVENYFY